MNEKITDRKQKIKDHFSSRSVLKKVDTLGYFDFSTYLISLETINGEDLINSDAFHKPVIDDQEYMRLIKFFPLAAHEYTHFIDATSTVWGINYLLKMHDAYICESSRIEKQFHKAKSFHDYRKGIFLSDYYTLIEDGIESRPWTFNLSIGRQFDKEGKVSDSSILFLRFSNHKGEAIVRSPISTASVLEASAMAQEIRVNSQLILKTDLKSRELKSGSFEEKTLSYFYNKKITEYSSCIHLVSTHFQIPDVCMAFDICSTLTGIVLNFPSKAFEQVLKSCDFKGILNISDQNWISAIIDGLKNKNLGILFMLLMNATDVNQLKLLGHREAIKLAIERVTSWNFVHFQSEVTLEFLGITKILSNSSIESIRSISASGLKNFGKIPTLREGLNFEDLDLPPFYDRDLTQQKLFAGETNGLRDLNLDNVFDELHKGESWVANFYSACI